MNPWFVCRANCRARSHVMRVVLTGSCVVMALVAPPWGPWASAGPTPLRSASRVPAVDSRPVYRIEVTDADELAILKQQLKIDVVRASARQALIRLPRPATLASLRQAGYEPVAVPREQVEHRIVHVSRGKPEPVLLGTGVTLLRRESGAWIIRASLAQLDQLRRLGFAWRAPDKEVRPREVEITVPSREDVQSVYDLGVDIFGAAEVAKGMIRIGGAAFDGQIDELRHRGYQVRPR
jgi:hypothetical protein